MDSIFTFIFLGISMAATIGPVKTVLLNTGLKNGFFHAWFFSLGAIATDIIYMFIVYFGIGQFINSIWLKTILWSFGCFVLCTPESKIYCRYIKLRWIRKQGKDTTETIPHDWIFHVFFESANHPFLAGNIRLHTRKNGWYLNRV
ncbi:LysE family translocator [Lysinibacillus sp. JK80]|uniref:LysE family translocator n=1 Tax=Lysinibacillus sp. JK80 TaxID=2749809 RepID=UPI002FD0185E